MVVELLLMVMVEYDIVIIMELIELKVMKPKVLTDYLQQQVIELLLVLVLALVFDTQITNENLCKPRYIQR